MLLGEIEAQLIRHAGIDHPERFEGRHRTKDPARTAAALVPHGRDPVAAVVPPVDNDGQVLVRRTGHRRRMGSRHDRAATQSQPLFPGQQSDGIEVRFPVLTEPGNRLPDPSQLLELFHRGQFLGENGEAEK